MINLSLISPSSVGQYAACSMRLVWDSQFGKPRKASPAADFGTVCHWLAMTELGCGPLDPPSDAIIKGAAERFEGDIERMHEQAMTCARFANTKLPALAPGTKWVAELNVHDPSLLPERVNRRGEKKGYGGSIDLLMSDNSHVVDYKFVGELPHHVKIEYVWQMGSYSFLKNVPLTTILFTTRDAKHSTKITIDWRIPRFAAYRDQMRTFIHRCGLADFERYAFCMAGDHCDWCDHKARCAAHTGAMPVLELEIPGLTPKPNLGAIDNMRKLLALREGMVQPTAETAFAAQQPTVQAMGVMPKLDASADAKRNLF